MLSERFLYTMRFGLSESHLSLDRGWKAVPQTFILNLKEFCEIEKEKKWYIWHKTFENKSSFTHLTLQALSASTRILVLLTVQTKTSKSPKGKHKPK